MHSKSIHHSLLAALMTTTLLTACGGSSTPPSNNLGPVTPPPVSGCHIEITGDSLVVFQSNLSACDLDTSGGAEVVFDNGAAAVGDNCQLTINNGSLAGASGSCGSYRISTRPADGDYRPANLLSPYAGKLTDCIFEYPDIDNEDDWLDFVLDNLCLLNEVPLVGDDNSDISVVAILDQTQVTHPWMAERFEQLLEAMPQDLLNLFRGVTGVVIGAEIRPSYYWQGTGAIYLDPADLWLTAAERNSISRAEDPRGSYGSQLQFNAFWDYLKDDDFAWEYFPLDGSNGNSRTLDDILLPMASLLFHELAHANDNVPPRQLNSVNENQYFLDLLSVLEAGSASAQLDQTYPLQSQVLVDMAEVRSFGATPTSAHIALQADDIGNEFEPDGANDLYNYSFYYESDDYRIFSEDTAMLFEEVMMKHHFDVDRVLAFTDAGESFEDYIVRWGRINRAGNDYVKERAELVIRILLGVDDASAYLASMPAPTTMTTGVNFGESLFAYLDTQAGSQKPRLNSRSLAPRQPRAHHHPRDHRLLEVLRHRH